MGGAKAVAGWMSGGTKGIKSRWVTIVVDREQLDASISAGPYGTTLREIVAEGGGVVYGD